MCVSFLLKPEQREFYPSLWTKLRYDTLDSGVIHFLTPYVYRPLLKSPHSFCHGFRDPPFRPLGTPTSPYLFSPAPSPNRQPSTRTNLATVKETHSTPRCTPELIPLYYGEHSVRSRLRLSCRSVPKTFLGPLYKESYHNRTWFTIVTSTTLSQPEAYINFHFDFS